MTSPSPAARSAALSRRLSDGLCLLFLGLLSASCHRQRTVPPNPVETTPAPPVSVESLPGTSDTELVGIASWYGHPYHGRRASNGETYDMNKLTAAHRTLPFDTLVNVLNLENGKKVEVRINDRGPFVQGRIIDLSYAAARQIDMIGPGTARVRVELIRSVSNPYPLTIQVGAFQEKSNAEKVSAALRPTYPDLEIREFENEKGTFYRVLVGQFKNSSEANAALLDLQNHRYAGFVVRLDPR